MLVGMQKMQPEPACGPRGRPKAELRMQRDRPCWGGQFAIRIPQWSPEDGFAPAGAWGDRLAQPTAGAVSYSLALLRSFMGRARVPSALRESQRLAALVPPKTEKSRPIKPDQTSFMTSIQPRFGRSPHWGHPRTRQLIKDSPPRARRRCGGRRTAALRRRWQLRSAAGSQTSRSDNASSTSSAFSHVSLCHVAATDPAAQDTVALRHGTAGKSRNYETNPIFLEQVKFGYVYETMPYSNFRHQIKLGSFGFVCGGRCFAGHRIFT